MHIAIVGAGFLGLACTWQHLLHPDTTVTLIDAKGIGGGASGIAAGLLHPFAGKKAQLNYSGLEALQATCELIDVAEKALGKRVALKTGVFRPITNEAQNAFFSNTLKTYPEHVFTKEALNLSGIFIPMGMTVDCPLYLEGIFQACKERGVRYQLQTITDARSLEHFDATLFTVGVGFNDIYGLESARIHPIKGQLLELEAHETLPFGMSAQAYLAQTTETKLIAGTTYEHSWEIDGPDRARCEEEIRYKVGKICPEIATLPLISCKAGFRATTPDKRPFIKQVGKKMWCLGGLGSKGLLYHNWLAKKFAHAFFSGSSITS